MNPQKHMHSLLQRIATGPELSKDVSRDEARLGMELVLQDQVDPVQAGLFLIALRMKRETDEEVLGVQDAILSHVSRAEVDVDNLVEISDPFNGYARGLPMSPFLPALLAVCGVPAICHGVKSVGPKYGVTHQNVLSAAGAVTDLSMSEAARRVEDTKIGWAYVDQKVSCPMLYRLMELRDLMVKRTCITTIEVVTKPLSARHTHLVTGFVHKPYPPIYAVLARNAGYQSAVIIRGVEGGVIPSLQQPSKTFGYSECGDELVETRVTPDMVGINDAACRAVPLPGDQDPDDGEDAPVDVARAASAAASQGLEALGGKPGLAYNSLLYGGSLILAHLGHGSPEECARKISRVLDSGRARERIR